MRAFVIILLCFWQFVSTSMAQGDYKYTVTVYARDGSTLPGIKVWLYEQVSRTKLVEITGASGEVIFYPPAGSWTLNLEGLEAYHELEVPEGVKGKGSITVYYDRETIQAEKEFIEKRKSTVLRTILKKDLKGTPLYMDSCILRIRLLTPEAAPVPSIPVDIVSLQQGLKYSCVSGRNGTVSFMLPLQERFAVDVDGIENFSITGIMEYPGEATLELQYVPTMIVEKFYNDTIIQQLTEKQAPTTARTLLELTISHKDGRKAEWEPVYLEEIETGRVYKSKTDSQGRAKLLLPNGSRYLLHFKYQRDVDVFSLRKVHGVGHIQASITYKPDPWLQFPERYIPLPDELFYVDFQNFITRQLPEPEKKAGLFLRWGNQLFNKKTKYAVLEIGLATSSRERTLEFALPLNLCFVVDRSGSMAGYNRIESVKGSLTRFIKNLKPADKVALVTFNTSAYVDIPFSELGTKERFRSVMEELEPGGGTNIFNGLEAGLAEMSVAKDSGTPRHLILLSDGYGADEPATTIQLAREGIAKGIHISAIGVGECYNAALLHLLADESDGLMEHIGMSEEIYSVFGEKLTNLLFPLGDSAELTLRFHDRMKLKYLHGLTLIDSGKNFAKYKIGKLAYDQEKTLLVQFDMLNPGPELENMPVTIELTYFDLTEARYVTHQYEARLQWDESDPKLDVVCDNEYRKVFAIAILNQSMKVMAESFASGDVLKARHTVERAIEQLKEIYPKAQDEDVEKLVAQLSNYLKAIINVEKNAKNSKKG